MAAKLENTSQMHRLSMSYGFKNSISKLICSWKLVIFRIYHKNRLKIIIRHWRAPAKAKRVSNYAMKYRAFVYRQNMRLKTIQSNIALSFIYELRF